MHLCHIEPHRHGGSRESTNLVDGCRIHHHLFDEGAIRFLAFTGDKRPVFIVEGSNEILSPKPPPDDPVRSEPEEWLLKATGQRVPRKSKHPRADGAGFVADRPCLPPACPPPARSRPIGRPAYYLRI